MDLPYRTNNQCDIIHKDWQLYSQCWCNCEHTLFI